MQWNFIKARCIQEHKSDVKMGAIASQITRLVINQGLNQWHNTLHVFLTHWGRGTHICGSKLTVIGSDNGLSHGRRKAIIWTNAGILLIGALWTHFRRALRQRNFFLSFFLHVLRYEIETWYIHSVGSTTHQVWAPSQSDLFDPFYNQNSSNSFFPTCLINQMNRPNFALILIKWAFRPILILYSWAIFTLVA